MNGQQNFSTARSFPTDISDSLILLLRTSTFDYRFKTRKLKHTKNTEYVTPENFTVSYD